MHSNRARDDKTVVSTSCLTQGNCLILSVFKFAANFRMKRHKFYFIHPACITL